ncbi:MAG: DbpA RNA binding domain-containing protein, partial [Bacteroidia bacterium]
DHLPPFLPEKPMLEVLPEAFVRPEKSAWLTLYISAGKKDKVNKMDIVGMLLKKGNLAKEDLGLIEVLDFASYAAVRSDKMNGLLALIKNERIKNKKVKMEIS